MTFLNKLGKIIIEWLTPTYSETYIGVVEEATRSGDDIYCYNNVLSVTNKGDRVVKNVGFDVGPTRSSSANASRLEVAIWMAGGPVPSRLNITYKGEPIVSGPVAKPKEVTSKIESDGNLIKFPVKKPDEPKY